MRGMSVDEVIRDICNRCGQSERVVRDVLRAETESVQERLSRGERATLVGRCTMTPEIKKRLAVGGTIDTEIKVTAKATAIENRMKDIKAFKTPEDTESIPECVMMAQIPGLL